MAGRLFDKLEQEAFRAGIAARTKASMEWFRSTVSNRKVSRAALIGDGPTRSRQVYGSMYNFQYDPKTKATLPYYDTFPVIFVVDSAPGGFYGLNIHYLPLRQRAMLMDALYSLTTDKRYDESTTLKLSYQLLKRSARYKLFKPCVKHYLNSHIKSRRIKIDPVEWDMALFMPLQRFQKASSSQVYNRSMEMVA